MKNNVAEARAPKGWTEVDLADAMNVTTACINAVEHGPPEFRSPPKENPPQKPWYLRLFSLTDNTNDR